MADDRDVTAVHSVLRQRGQTVAVAESLTSGLLAAALTDTPGASETFRGGLVVYATDLKASLAGVDPALLAERGAVDADVARQLACGVRDRLSSTWGVATTGVAGPSPQDGQAVGTVFIAVAGPSATPDAGVVVRQLALSGDRNTIRQLSVTHAMAFLADTLHRSPDRSAARC